MQYIKYYQISNSFVVHYNSTRRWVNLLEYSQAVQGHATPSSWAPGDEKMDTIWRQVFSEILLWNVLKILSTWLPVTARCSTRLCCNLRGGWNEIRLFVKPERSHIAILISASILLVVYVVRSYCSKFVYKPQIVWKRYELQWTEIWNFQRLVCNTCKHAGEKHIKVHHLWNGCIHGSFCVDLTATTAFHSDRILLTYFVIASRVFWIPKKWTVSLHFNHLCRFPSNSSDISIRFCWIFMYSSGNFHKFSPLIPEVRHQVSHNGNVARHGGTR